MMMTLGLLQEVAKKAATLSAASIICWTINFPFCLFCISTAGIQMADFDRLSMVSSSPPTSELATSTAGASNVVSRSDRNNVVVKIGLVGDAQVSDCAGVFCHLISLRSGWKDDFDGKIR